MREPDFPRLRERLLDAGVAPRHARRTVQELRDHYADLYRDLLAEGRGESAARDEAARQLGQLDAIAHIIEARPELRRWTLRHPRAGRVLLPVACVLMLPVSPLIAGVNYAPQIARWGMIVSASAVITAAILLAMQLSISLG